MTLKTAPVISVKIVAPTALLFMCRSIAGGVMGI